MMQKYTFNFELTVKNLWYADLDDRTVCPLILDDD